MMEICENNLILSLAAILKWFISTLRPRHHHQEFVSSMPVNAKWRQCALETDSLSALKFQKTVRHTFIKTIWNSFLNDDNFQLLTVSLPVHALPWPRTRRVLSRSSMTMDVPLTPPFSLPSHPMAMHCSPSMRPSDSPRATVSSSSVTSNTVWDHVSRPSANGDVTRLSHGAGNVVRYQGM